MSNVQQFFKENRAEKNNIFFAATKQFKDEKGEPIKWELRPIPTKTMEDIKWRCMDNKRKLAIEMILASVVFPPLRDTELQDSYGVKKPEDLLYELLAPAEVDMLEAQIVKLNGYDVGFDDLVGEAKNL